MGPPTFFKSLEILSDLNDQEISLLAADAQWIDYGPSEQVIKRGEIGRFLWIVYEGEVKVMIPAVGTAGEISKSLERGALFGEMSIMTGEPAIADVMTATACKLIKIPRESFSRLIAGNPKTLGKFA
ncbi:MAG: cyclic nucleotide-binding domain-containing protein, partial [Deltaproteobacteria bacterium]|nr:cyclic nucleotide-binding domain-containing protein [Deltaproteobacteria bacterium]